MHRRQPWNPAGEARRQALGRLGLAAHDHWTRVRQIRLPGGADARLHRLVDAVEAFDVATDGRQRDVRDPVGVHQHEVLVKPALLVPDALVRHHAEGVFDQGPGEGVVLHLSLCQVKVAQ